MDRRTGIILAITIGTVLIIMAASAWFALRTSSEILDSFHRIDSGLDSVRSTLDDRSAASRAMLSSFMCKEMVAKADSVHLAYSDLKARIDSFKLRLVTAAIDNIHAADSVFASEDQGPHLHRAFSDFFALAERTCTNDSIDMHIDQYARSVRDKPTVPEWRAANFEGVPVVACITLLSKFQTDALNAEALVMNDLLARCDSTKK